MALILFKLIDKPTGLAGTERTVAQDEHIRLLTYVTIIQRENWE